MPTIQELWNELFSSEGGCLDVTKYLAIKKIVSVHSHHNDITLFMDGLVTGLQQTQYMAQQYQ